MHSCFFAGLMAFSSGTLDRRSRAKRLCYEEMKALYAEALRIGADFKGFRQGGCTGTGATGCSPKKSMRCKEYSAS